LHLWHGELDDRRYVERNEMLARFGFDPARDLVLEDGLWAWSCAHDPALAMWLRRYFVERRDDGRTLALSSRA
jgi:hypothetical protein